MPPRDITGALFCLAVQHHWEENGFQGPNKDHPELYQQMWRCDNCGSARLDFEDVHGILHYRSYNYTAEFRDAQHFADRMNEFYTTKQQYRAAYLKFRRQRATQHKTNLRRVQ